MLLFILRIPEAWHLELLRKCFLSEWQGKGGLPLPFCALSDISRLPGWERGHLLASVASSTDASTFSSEGGSPLPVVWWQEEGGKCLVLKQLPSYPTCIPSCTIQREAPITLLLCTALYGAQTSLTYVN